MSEIRIVREYPHQPEKVWRALTDPRLVPFWTATGRGGKPEGFSPEVGCRFRFVGRPVPGWNGVIECEVLEARVPCLLRYSWKGDVKDKTTEVTYRIQPTATGTRFIYEHIGFSGIGGLVMSKLILGPVRRKMVEQGLPALLDELDDAGDLPPDSQLHSAARPAHGVR